MASSIFSKPVERITPEVSRALADILHKARSPKLSEQDVDFRDTKQTIEKIANAGKMSEGDRLKLRKLETKLNKLL